jgi:hypothetical protein
MEAQLEQTRRSIRSLSEKIVRIIFVLFIFTNLSWVKADPSYDDGVWLPIAKLDGSKWPPAYQFVQTSPVWDPWRRATSTVSQMVICRFDYVDIGPNRSGLLYHLPGITFISSDPKGNVITNGLGCASNLFGKSVSGTNNFELLLSGSYHWAHVDGKPGGLVGGYIDKGITPQGVENRPTTLYGICRVNGSRSNPASGPADHDMPGGIDYGGRCFFISSFGIGHSDGNDYDVLKKN